MANTITLFLTSGDPNGLRTAHIDNWNGVAIASPRTELSNLIERTEVKGGSSIYILFGENTETGQTNIYFGEGNFRDRIRKHNSDTRKDYWTSVVVVNTDSSKNHLQKGEVLYLESKLINIFRKFKSDYIVKNDKVSVPELSESAESSMQTFLKNILKLLPVLGIHIPSIDSVNTNDNLNKLFCTIKEITAMGRRTSSGFIIYKNSKATLEHRESAGRIGEKRKQLINDGVLKKEGNHLFFTQDVEFTSPSLASSIVKGGHSNGMTSWKNESGKTLKEIERI
jgi:predicted GIY-YIG superfamily endonuclease